ncbi:MAG: hypothetical protein ACYCW6_32135, partial [Candidatus Xenobia bacterium]
EQEARAMAQREANERAAAAGEPLPYPNIFDFLDPTKVRPGATEEEIFQRHLEFRKICRKERKEHFL